MEFAIHGPAAPLDTYVESITCFAGLDPAHHREKLIPDGAIELIVDLGETPKKLYASETGGAAIDFRRAWISGMQRRSIVIEAQPGAALLVIRFRPGGAYPLLAHDAETLTDAVFDLDAVLGRIATSLRDRVLDASTPATRIAAAEAWLRERLSPEPVPLAVRHVVRRLSRPGVLRIRDLAEETGFTQRHLLSLFRRWIGVSPKQFARIQRFQQVLAALTGNHPTNPLLEAKRLPDPDWAAVAATFGYADQSHLSHEFRAFAGMTPGAYVAAYRGLSNYLPITLPETRPRG